jgi:anti-sigma-K factor RskA
MPETHLLTGAYALDALDDVERAGFERHLRECTACSTEVAEFAEAITSLATRVAEPAPPHVREQVLAQVSRTRQLPPVSQRQWRRRSLRRSVSVAAAAVLVAGAAGLGGVTWQQQRSAQTDQQAAQLEAAQVQAAQIARVMTDPGRREVAAAPAVGGAATVVSARGNAVFAADRLPALPDDQDYQLWLIDSSGIRSQGVLDLRSGSGQAFVGGVGPGSSIAVSVEPAGGSRQPTTTPVLNVQVAL